MTNHDFQIGEVVKAGTEFAGTVVYVDGDTIRVENRDGEQREFQPGDLKYTA